MNHIKSIGLTQEEVEKAREKYGTNALVSLPKENFFRQLLRSLGDPIIRIFINCFGN